MVEAEVQRGLIERRTGSDSARALTVFVDDSGSKSSGKLPGVEGGAVVYGSVLVLSARIEGSEACRPVVEVVEQWALAPEGAVASAERRSDRVEEMVMRGSRLLLDKLTLEPECQ